MSCTRLVRVIRLIFSHPPSRWCRAKCGAGTALHGLPGRPVCLLRGILVLDNMVPGRGGTGAVQTQYTINSPK
jgi:hypothetical protein